MYVANAITWQFYDYSASRFVMSTTLDSNGVNKTNRDGKNKDRIFCSFCPSKILNAEAASLVNIEFPLPRITSGRENEAECKEVVTNYWLVEDMYTFENIGMSNTVENIKYLACADCEKGPVGWHDLLTKKSYVALSRVNHDS